LAHHNGYAELPEKSSVFFPEFVSIVWVASSELIYEFGITVERFDRPEAFYCGLAVDTCLYQELNHPAHVRLDDSELNAGIGRSVVVGLLGCVEPDLLNGDGFFQQAQKGG